MPQGKMKVKAKGAPPAKKDKGKKAHGGIQKGGNNLKKGKFTIAPKKQVKLAKYLRLDSVQFTKSLFQHHQAVFKFKQNVRKEINAKNEVGLLEAKLYNINTL